MHTLNDNQIILNQVFISKAGERGYWDYDESSSRFLLYVYDDDDDLSSNAVVTFASTEEQALKKQERFINSDELFSQKRRDRANYEALMKNQKDYPSTT